MRTNASTPRTAKNRFFFYLDELAFYRLGRSTTDNVLWLVSDQGVSARTTEQQNAASAQS